MTRFIGHGRDEVTPREELVSVEEHLAAILDLLPRPDPIELRSADALGLALAEDITCEERVPALDNSAMDGYAVDSRDLAQASRDLPRRLSVVGEALAGGPPGPAVQTSTCVRIMTGAPIPMGADAVVPVELTMSEGDVTVFLAPVASGENIRRAGEDLTPGRPLAQAGRRVTPADIALFTTAGRMRVRCYPAPRVVVMSTGDELVRGDEPISAGQVRDSNGPMLSALVRAAGGLPFATGIVRDSAAALAEAFEANRGHADLFVCTGGASAGARDLLPEVLASIGEARSVKVAMRPGMPQIRGLVHGTPVIGLPGNPVSAFVSFEVFVRPAIRTLQGRRDVQRPTIVARAAEELTAPPHKRGYVRVKIGRDREAGGWQVRPTGAQGSHLVSSIADADGLAIVPETVTRIAAGDEVRVIMLVE